MNRNLLRQHIFRAWSRHWSLQLASVTVMTLVLMMLNALLFGFDVFNATINKWGQGLDAIVYFKESVPVDKIEEIRKQIEDSRDFVDVKFSNREESTKRFLQSMGPDAQELLEDPKWKSPIPDSLELKLSSKINMTDRPQVLENWSQRLGASGLIEDFFYGQGWIENFARFVSGAKGLILAIWILSLSVGLLIVSNCIGLSFWQRRDEIEVLELVGATRGFIRKPFLVEGLTLGLLSAGLSLGLSYLLHSAAIGWANQDLGFWISLDGVRALGWMSFAMNGITGLAFGFWGAWNCVRKLNTGWSAASR